MKSFTSKSLKEVEIEPFEGMATLASGHSGQNTRAVTERESTSFGTWTMRANTR